MEGWIIFARWNGSLHRAEIHKQFTPLFKDNTPADYRPIAKDNVLDGLTFVDKHLAGRQWLAGDGLPLADSICS